jgi:hypothetical protein
MALINPQTGSSSIYDPSLPSRIARGAPVPQQPEDTIASIDPGQGPQYNPSFGMDTSPQGTPPPLISSILASQAKPPTGVYGPSMGPAQSVKGNYLNGSLGNLDARGAPYPATAARPAVAPSNTGPGGANVGGVFNNLPANVFDGANTPQTAQAPAPATPQGWNLFTALGQALGHLLGYNAQGQPQGMSGLIRNPVQTPTQTPGLRMPTPVQQAARYQGRTLLG